MPMPMSEQPDVAFLRFVFSVRFVPNLWLNDTYYDTTAKVSEEANTKLRAMNTMEQLLVLYTDPERYNTQTDGRTDR